MRKDKMWFLRIVDRVNAGKYDLDIRVQDGLFYRTSIIIKLDK